MGLIDNINQACHNIRQGLQEVGKGIESGNLKEAFDGVTKAANGVVNASPLGLAANELSGGALRKMCDGEEKHLDKAFSRVDDGLKEIAQGVATGDLSEIGKGAVSAGWGGLELARAGTPLGVAEGTVGDGFIKPAVTGESAADSVAQLNAQAVS